MPLDPFFASIKKPLPERQMSDEPIVRIKSTRYVDKHARNVAKKIRKSGGIVRGKPSITGFKPPKKVWDEKR